MTASKDFKRLEHKNLRHFNFFYQDVSCLGHQPSSLGDGYQCWYWGGLPDNFSRNYEIQATRAKVSLWLIWYLLEPWWGVMIHWVWALMTRVQYIVRSWVFRSSRIRSVWIFFCVQVVKSWSTVITEVTLKPKKLKQKNIAKGTKDPSVDCFCQSKGTNIYNKITPTSDQTISIFWQNVKIVSSNCCQDVSCH